MMKYLLTFLLLTLISFGQQKYFAGRIVDSETSEPLALANVRSGQTENIVQADDNGFFQIKTIASVSEIDISISHVGYETKEMKLAIGKNSTDLIIQLRRKLIPAQSVLVTASVNKKGETPATFSEISGKDIERKFSVQDIPEFLSSIPSTTFYSESGNGIGYNYLSIRGFDQRRISISINGIPQNDPEDHNVYWVDFSDILASTEFIQVQRGSGGIFGYPSIGGSINIITSNFSLNKYIKASSILGSYTTRKYSVSASSGLIEGKYSFSGKVSQTLSSGYRDRSWVDLKSYYFSLSRIDGNFTTQINLFGGPIKDGLVYNGLPKFAIKDKNLRRKNLSYWEATASELTYSDQRRKQEIENFSQPHYEMLNEFKINDDVTFNSALFLVIGKGFFDFDGSWADTSYLRLTQENGFPNVQSPANSLLRGMVENKQFGWIPRIQLNHSNGVLTSGLEFRSHRSLHYGSIVSAENITNAHIINYRYYEFNGGKDIINVFVNEQYKVNEQIGLLGELQIAYNKYRLSNEKFIGRDFSIKHSFFNPRLGINYKFTDAASAYVSFARVSREPRLNDYYNAVESSGGAVPQFEVNNNGNYDYTKPLVKPETMNSFDLGYSMIQKDFQINLNLFYMSFENELVKNGRLDIFGAPIMGNAKRTIHSGMELSSSVKPGEYLQIIFNATYSQNKINEATTFIAAYDQQGNSLYRDLPLNGNSIGGFPDFLLNASIRYSIENLYIQLDGKYVGKFFSDNYGAKLPSYILEYPGFVDYSDNVNDAFFAFNSFFSYEVDLFNTLTKSKIFLQVNNVFNTYYSMYAIGKEFFPAAERNFVAGLQLGI
ncbi:MAG: TonB-dependent receptor [Ignavibacteria bacterium CG22_combo_CG10-13_8_21_14_all_37_15]|nr:MAG: TonB-dependent receptor [Ignavibacteria bacterium CG22_combo_CG10-13_8_21_14_all_37_15]